MSFGTLSARSLSNRRQRRARSVLLWSVLCYAAIQISLALAEDWYLPFLRDPDYGHRAVRLKQRLTSTRETPTTVVMLGSSRTLNGLRAGPIEQGLRQQTDNPTVLFNFGIPAAGPVMHLLILKRLLSNGIRPDGLLVEVMPAYLAGVDSRWTAAGLPLQRLWPADMPEIKALDPRHRDRSSPWRRQAWLWPCYAHRLSILRYLAPMLLPAEQRCDFSRRIDDCGWVEVPDMPGSAAARRSHTEKAHQQFAGYWNDSQPGGPSCDALRRLLRLCRHEGIAVKLVIMPEGQTFRSWYPEAGWRAFEAFLEELRREFGVEVVNAREWIEEDGFFDSHHLLPAGAERFSARLGREVLAPWFLQLRRTVLQTVLVVDGLQNRPTELGPCPASKLQP